MRRIEIDAGVPQLPLVFKEKVNDIPVTLDGLNGGAEVHQILTRQKLWNERTQRSDKDILLVDNRSGMSGLLDHKTLGFTKVSFSEETLTTNRLSTIIFLTHEVSQDDSLLGLDNLNFIRKKRLTTAGVIFVFEEKSESAEFDKDWRMERLKEAEFKVVGVLPGLSKEFNVWRGRREKKTKKKGVNFLDFPDTKQGKKNEAWFRTCYRTAKNNYIKDNLEVLRKSDVIRLDIGYEGHPVFERLKDTTNIPDDMSKLKLGFGLIVEGKTCGCIVEITLKGTKERHRDCKELKGACQFPKKEEE